MKYLKLFDLDADYQAFMGGGEFVTPNVSYTLESQIVYFNPGAIIPSEPDYSKEYFTFTALEDSTVKIVDFFTNSTPTINILYSKNNEEWITWDFTDISLSMGDTLRFKGNNPDGFSSMNNGCVNTFSNSTGKVDVSGNIMSLLYGDDFQNKTDLPCELCFAYLFGSMSGNVTTFVNAENLILPATALTAGCYGGMFQGCTSLVTAPELPATTLASQCYVQMFAGCTSLNYIKMLATDISADMCLSYWVGDVSPTGTFIKSAGVEIPTGNNGIPSGWTVEEVGFHYSKEYFTFTALEDSTVKIFGGGIESIQNGNSMPCVNLEYSKNNGEWIVWDYTDISLLSGDTLKLKGNNPNGFSIGSLEYLTQLHTFYQSTGKMDISGNIMSLLYGDDFQNKTEIPCEGCFMFLFGFEVGDVTSFVSAENLILPATTLADSCYLAMFGNCSSLTSTPELPATTLADWCYGSMFLNCTSLTTTPELPATTLANSCYYQMFCGCTSLTSAPELPATALATQCYGSMFSKCTSLTSAPELPATTLANYCYQSMFQSCTLLTSAPELPATILTSSCYANMFWGCTSLTTAPELPATTLAQSCYSNMFLNCNSLTTAPELPATTLANSCYYQMFYDCTSLNYIKMLATDISASNCLNNWVNNVSSTGIFVKSAGVNILSGINGIPSGWTVESDYSTQYLTFTALEDSTFKLTKNACEYSLDNGSTWVNLPSGTTTTTVSAGNKIMFKCTNPTIPTTYPNYGIGTFSSTGKFNVEGNIMSMLYGDDFVGQTDLTDKTHVFSGLFRECTTVVNAKDLVLPATTLAYGCYGSMFGNCSSLTSTPELPATTLADWCYGSMFFNCNSLTTAPELPATTLAESCYDGMFKQCFSLTTAPELPATTLASSCYRSMFNNCGSLTSAPSILPATTLADYCYYYMFCYCDELTTAPELPATTLANNCYEYMFSNCTSLNYIKMLATDISATDCTYNWVSKVSSTGTFIKSAGVEIPTGVSGVPSGWTVEEV